MVRDDLVDDSGLGRPERLGLPRNPERLALEIIVRLKEDAEDQLFWVAIKGAGGASLDTSEHPIDRDHQSQARRTKEPGWVEAEPRVLPLPEPVRHAVLDWALRD